MLASLAVPALRHQRLTLPTQASSCRLAAPLPPVQPSQHLLQRRVRLNCSAVAEPTVKMGGGRKRGGGGKRQAPAQHQHHVQTLLEQQATTAEAQLQHPAPASRGRRHTAAPPPPLPPNPDLLPIAFADGKVTVGDGLVLLDRISPQARQPHREPDAAPGAAALAATDMVLLSFAAAKGPTCMEDFALGAVSWAGWRRCLWLKHGPHISAVAVFVDAVGAC